MLLWLAMLVVLIRQGDPPWFLIAYGAFIVPYGLAYYDALVYGEADERGIFYRRYIRRLFLPWTAVRDVKWWKAYGITIHLKERRWPRDRLVFVTVKNLEDMRLEVAENREPDTLAWIEQQIARASREQFTWRVG